MERQNNSSFTILTLLFLFSVVLASPPSSWPYFHPNSGQTSIAIPDQIDTSWQVNFGDSIQIYPTISPITGWINQHQQEVVYLGTSIGVFCVSVDHGQIIWFYHTTQPVKYTPAYWDTNRLYVPAGDSLICLNPTTGQWLWGYHCSGNLFHVIGLGDYVGVVDDSSYVYVFAYQTNQLAWRSELLSPKGGCDNTSLVLDSHGCVYVVTGGNQSAYYDFKIFKFNLDSGQVVWSSAEGPLWEPGGVRMSPVLRHDSILVFGTHTDFGWTSSIYNYRTSDHWRTYRQTFTYSDGPVMASPAVDSGGHTYFPTANFFLALDDSNGQIRQYDFPFDASSPVIDPNHKIIFGTLDGRLIVIDQTNGLISEFPCSGDLASPAIGSDGSIYIAGNNTIYKFSASLGQPEGSVKVVKRNDCFGVHPNPFHQQLMVDGASGLVEIYALNGRLLCRAKQPGLFKWRTNGLPGGVYLVKINRQIFKVVKD